MALDACEKLLTESSGHLGRNVREASRRAFCESSIVVCRVVCAWQVRTRDVIHPARTLRVAFEGEVKQDRNCKLVSLLRQMLWENHVKVP